jgi:hypothetical protein
MAAKRTGLPLAVRGKRGKGPSHICQFCQWPGAHPSPLFSSSLNRPRQNCYGASQVLMSSHLHARSVCPSFLGDELGVWGYHPFCTKTLFRSLLELELELALMNFFNSAIHASLLLPREPLYSLAPPRLAWGQKKRKKGSHLCFFILCLFTRHRKER